jgi:hypothetical protein
MSVVVRFSPASATPQHYDEANRRVKRGEELSDGCDYHVAFIGPDGNVRVSEVWTRGGRRRLGAGASCRC